MPEAPPPPPPPPTYSARLGLPEPDLAVLVADSEFTLRHLALAVILLRSRPVGWDELAEAIGALGARGSGPRLRTSITKALAGAPALVRRGDGRLDLDLSSPAWRWYGIATRRAMRAVAKLPSPEASTPEVDPDQPITREELGDLLPAHAPSTLSPTARLVAAIDVAGHPVTPEEAEALLDEWTGATGKRAESSLHRFTSPLFSRSAEHVFSLLDPEALAPKDRATLRAARASVRAAVAEERERRRREASWAEYAEKSKARERREIVEAQCARRALVHPFLVGGRLLAVSILDAVERTTTTLVGDEEVGRLPAYLSGYDVLVGHGLPGALAALDRLNAQPARLVDLADTPRTQRIRGRIVKVTSKDWIRGSLGIAKPLGDPDLMARALARGQRARFVARLEKDAKTLFAFYRYGVIQRGVRLRLRGVDELVRVDWSEPGDGSIHGYVAELKKGGGRIEAVFPPVPRFEAPWEHKAFLHMGPSGVTLTPGGGLWIARGQLSRMDVLDARPE